MKQSDLIDALFEETGVKKSDILMVLQAMKQVALEQVSKGQEFNLDGICKISVVQKPKRNAMNLQTNKPMIVPARMGIKIKVMGGLKEAVKQLEVND